MTPNGQLIGFILAICIPSLTALTGVLLSNSRITDINARIGDAHLRVSGASRVEPSIPG